jgi:metal-sulfur cluster biosynthetic enzyme
VPTAVTAQSPESPATAPNPAAPDTTPPTNRTANAVSDDQVKLALRRVKDPDLQLNIVDLGLVYGVRIDGDVVNVDVTLTSPGCPSGPDIIGNIEKEIQTLPGVASVQVNLIWTPFWTPDRIEPRIRAYLGL